MKRDLVSNLRFIAKRYALSREDFEDCFQVGTIAAWLALQRGSPSETYVLRAARFAISNHAQAERRWRMRMGLTGDIALVTDIRRPGIDFAPALIDALTELEHRRQPLTERLPLTDRERDVLDRICKGMTLHEVATDLEVSVRVVRFHVANVYRKFGARNSIEAYNEGIRRGLVVPPRREV